MDPADEFYSAAYVVVFFFVCVCRGLAVFILAGCKQVQITVLINGTKYIAVCEMYENLYTGRNLFEEQKESGL